MLDADYRVYKHVETGETIVRTTGYSLPSILHEHVSVVSPTTYFGTVRAMASQILQEPGGDQSSTCKNAPARGDVPGSCVCYITPACLLAMYNAAGYKPAATDKNTLGVAGYLDQFANHADLQTFLQIFLPDAVGSSFATVKINGGGDDQSKPKNESNLDIQYTLSLTHPTPNIYYRQHGGISAFYPDYITTDNTNEPYLDWLQYITAQPEIPQTISTSYGDDEQTVPRDYAETVCSMFAQLGVRGSSVLFGSGDFGVGEGDCLTNDGTKATKFQPMFPASCPFVTSVGATIGVKPETAATFTGGGFSDYFPRPSYQDQAVPAYIDNLNGVYDGLYNVGGRGIPDVAARGDNYIIVVGGKAFTIDGTSASTPTVAALISLLNDYRISHGLSPLGFLNPLLYSKGAAGLVDIIGGTNPGCGTDGFTATEGWDPLTGLGTLDFEKLQSIVL